MLKKTRVFLFQPFVSFYSFFYIHFNFSFASFTWQQVFLRFSCQSLRRKLSCWIEALSMADLWPLCSLTRVTMKSLQSVLRFTARKLILNQTKRSPIRQKKEKRTEKSHNKCLLFFWRCRDARAICQPLEETSDLGPVCGAPEVFPLFRTQSNSSAVVWVNWQKVLESKLQYTRKYPHKKFSL